MKIKMPFFFSLPVVLLLVGCAVRPQLAPVEELKWQNNKNNTGVHIVKKGETLYSIAFRYDKDYRSLAAYNHLNNPYSLQIGQTLRLQQSDKRTRRPQTKAVYHPAMAQHKVYPVHKMPATSQQSHIPLYSSAHGQWLWPAHGKVVASFVPEQGKKGINIAGKKGEPVQAAADGTVAYAGSGLAGYGNLIIIKHDGQFLTAYANNLKNRVKEGQKVKAGQIIAEMGVIDREFWGVHFEIRKAGQPVNPLAYLQKPTV